MSNLAKAYKNKKDEHGDYAQTPWWVIRQIQAITGYQIAWDVCAQVQTKKAPLAYIGGEIDALAINWCDDMYGHFEEIENPPRNWAAWMNPPFSQAQEFTQKASFEASKGMVVIGCVKDAPDTTWYQEHVESNATVIYKPTSRIQFVKPDGTPFMRLDKKQKKWVKSGTNFPVCFPVWTSMAVRDVFYKAPTVRFTPMPEVYAPTIQPSIKLVEVPHGN